MNANEFQALLEPVMDTISKNQIDKSLEDELNRLYPAGSEYFEQIDQACQQAIEAGWMCTQGSEGRRFGRVIKPTEETRQLSVDVVDLTDIAGPHHRHPMGEICMVLPVTKTALFDGRPRGWVVYPADSSHRPTVSQGQALVLYLLPDGQIEFS